jgi:hypothetical protein
MTIHKILYLLIFITATFLALTTFYIEFRVLSEMVDFEGPTYNLPYYNIKLKGGLASLAHLGNITFSILALTVAINSYKNLRK